MVQTLQPISSRGATSIVAFQVLGSLRHLETHSLQVPTCCVTLKAWVPSKQNLVSPLSTYYGQDLNGSWFYQCGFYSFITILDKVMSLKPPFLLLISERGIPYAAARVKVGICSTYRNFKTISESEFSTPWGVFMPTNVHALHIIFVRIRGIMLGIRSIQEVPKYSATVLFPL